MENHGIHMENQGFQLASFVSPHDDVEIEPLDHFVDSLQRKLEGKKAHIEIAKKIFLIFSSLTQ